MGKSGGKGVRRAAVVLLGLAVSLAARCSRPSEFPADDAASPANRNKLPFEDNAAKTAGADANPGDGKLAASSNREVKSADAAPFQDLASIPELPAGTLIPVRLAKPISSDRIADEATFAAAVDEPILIEGKIAVPRESAVTGVIESGPAAASGRGRAYLRLTLDSITVAGRKLPVRSSSLFIRGRAGEVSSKGPSEHSAASETRLQEGRRLTFRLAEALPVFRQETSSQGQNHLPAAQ